MPVEELAALFKGENLDTTGVELALCSTGRTSQRRPADLIQTVILTSCPHSLARNGKREREVCSDWCFSISFLSTHSPSPARFPAPFRLWRRGSTSPGGGGSPMPAFQMCVLTNYITGEDVQLKQGFLAKKIFTT